jgi:hypothetical protein
MFGPTITALLFVIAQVTSATPGGAANASEPKPTPTPTATPDIPVYVGNPATRFTIEQRVEGFDPDGKARLLLVAHFWDAQNKPTIILANSDLDWTSSRGHVQWQNRMRYGSPAAVILVDTDGPIDATVRANKPNLGSVNVHADTRTWREPRVVASALGPHMAQIGWFPRATSAVHIERIDVAGKRETLADLPVGSSTYRDTTVEPAKHYRYVVTRGTNRVALATVTTPPALGKTDVSMASGKAMWLFWSLNPIDDDYYGKLNARAIVDQAAKAGLHYVEIRTAYGAQWQIPPAAKSTIDAIIDGLAAHHIIAMGWTVPREVTFEDLAASVRTTQYRTAAGTPLQGIALDLERGDDFLGADPNGLNALWMYEQYLRKALGPKYLIVATVEDPSFEHLDNSKYPFRKVAQYADVLQPMAYWRMLRRTPTTPDQVKSLLRASYTALLGQSGRTLPISIGGQTSSEGTNGNPPAAEVLASLQASKAAGAIGECFFDWSGTQPDQWEALASYAW